MSDDTRDRLIRLEHGQDALRGDLNTLRGDVNTLRDDVHTLRNDMNMLRSDVNALRSDVAEMKSTLSQLIPMMVRIDQRLSDTPKASEFYERRGRVEEISRHQPTTLAYAPPPAKAAG